MTEIFVHGAGYVGKGETLCSLVRQGHALMRLLLLQCCSTLLTPASLLRAQVGEGVGGGGGQVKGESGVTPLPVHFPGDHVTCGQQRVKNVLCCSCTRCNNEMNK